MATKPNDDNSLSHTRWNCKYHIVFIPKYRRKEIYGKIREDIGKILRTLYEYKEVEIIEEHAMKDHIHMLLAIPPKIAVYSFTGQYNYAVSINGGAQTAATGNDYSFDVAANDTIVITATSTAYLYNLVISGK